MLSVIIRVAGVTAAAGFAAGILASHKAGKAKDKVKDKFSKTEVRVIEVELPKGTDLSQCRIDVVIPSSEK